MNSSIWKFVLSSLVIFVAILIGVLLSTAYSGQSYSEAWALNWKLYSGVLCFFIFSNFISYSRMAKVKANG